MLTKRNSNLPLVCQICGDTARGINFNVMSCVSCKTFFRRHSNKSSIDEKKSRSLKCSKENNCEVNLTTRGSCTACRLNKCLTLGMDPTIVGSHRYELKKSNDGRSMKKSESKTNSQLTQPCTLNLLQNDRSTLSRNEWDLFSNIIHAYDATEIIPNTRQLLEAQSILPHKIRSKTSLSLDIHKQFFSSFLPFIQRTRFFHEFSKETCEELTENNFRVFGTFHGGFLMRELNGMNYPVFRNSLSAFFTDSIEDIFHRFVSNLESDCSLVKIILMILAFSPNSSIVTFHPSKTNFKFGNSILILNVQNIIVTMFWKYLLYQYGFVTAVAKFSSHVKYILDLLKTVYELENLQNSQVVYKMIDETKRTLIISE